MSGQVQLRRSARVRTQATTAVASTSTSVKSKRKLSLSDDDSDLTPLEDENSVATVGKRRPQKAAVPEGTESNGYACLNTILRSKRPAAESIFCSRTCRIDTIKKNGMEWVKDLGRKNCQDLLSIIQWNDENNIRFMRISSEMFPFASHATYGYSLDYCTPLLSQVGALASQLGHRLTMHPGQFTQLGSPRAEVVQSSLRELQYHAEMMERNGARCGWSNDCSFVRQGGGVYEDKAATIERIKETITRVLPKNVRERLVLENDELCYNAEDLLPLCEELDIPLVFGKSHYHHDALHPSSISRREIIERANAIWIRRGIKPKQHLSEPRPGAETLMERRAHADRCQSLPEELPEDMDLMIEAKDKEQAVLHLYRIYGLQPVKQESLRPPDENQTKETKGRKSNKKGKKKEGGEEEADDLEEDVYLTGPVAVEYEPQPPASKRRKRATVKT
ncbi:endonuclease Uve1 [Armillaria novae-zelandiae]|uniref:Endonuclease Uve1 n=1 Tax=Armillaria novae-zelandiae TaxID=153914 RepID=A0AA39P377_9AGAR|nr:endonuclease Uve1 [Armillaria novae-zelandiae]